MEASELYHNGIRKGVCDEVGCKEGCWIWGRKNWRLEAELGVPWQLQYNALQAHILSTFKTDISPVYYRFFILVYSSINKGPRGTEQYEQQALIYRIWTVGSEVQSSMNCGLLLHFYLTLLLLHLFSLQFLNLLTSRTHGCTCSTIVTHFHSYLWLIHSLSMTQLLLLDLTHMFLTQRPGI